MPRSHASPFFCLSIFPPFHLPASPSSCLSSALPDQGSGRNCGKTAGVSCRGRRIGAETPQNDRSLVPRKEDWGENHAKRPESAAGLRQKRPGSLLDSRASRSTAATYSPNWWVSTIGDGELNFSVRNGKRWFLTAIATAVYDLRERSRDCQPARPCAPIDTLRRKSLSRTYSLLQFHLRRIFP